MPEQDAAKTVSQHRPTVGFILYLFAVSAYASTISYDSCSACRLNFSMVNA